MKLHGSDLERTTTLAGMEMLLRQFGSLVNRRIITSSHRGYPLPKIMSKNALLRIRKPAAYFIPIRSRAKAKALLACFAGNYFSHRRDDTGRRHRKKLTNSNQKIVSTIQVMERLTSKPTLTN